MAPDAPVFRRVGGEALQLCSVRLLLLCLDVQRGAHTHAEQHDCDTACVAREGEGGTWPGRDREREGGDGMARAEVPVMNDREGDGRDVRYQDSKDPS